MIIKMCGVEQLKEKKDAISIFTFSCFPVLLFKGVTCLILSYVSCELTWAALISINRIMYHCYLAYTPHSTDVGKPITG